MVSPTILNLLHTTVQMFCKMKVRWARGRSDGGRIVIRVQKWLKRGKIHYDIVFSLASSSPNPTILLLIAISYSQKLLIGNPLSGAVALLVVFNWCFSAHNLAFFLMHFRDFLIEQLMREVNELQEHLEFIERDVSLSDTYFSNLFWTWIFH